MFVQTLRIFLGLTLIVAAIGKFIEPSNAIETLQKLFAFPIAATVFITMLSFIELFVGIGILLSDQNLPYFALGAVILMLCFLVFEASYAVEVMHDCGCYGAFRGVSESPTLRDSILLFCGVAVLLFPKSSLAIHKLPFKFATLFPVVIAVLFTFMFIWLPANVQESQGKGDVSKALIKQDSLLQYGEKLSPMFVQQLEHLTGEDLDADLRLVVMFSSLSPPLIVARLQGYTALRNWYGQSLFQVVAVYTGRPDDMLRPTLVRHGISVALATDDSGELREAVGLRHGKNAVLLFDKRGVVLFSERSFPEIEFVDQLLRVHVSPSEVAIKGRDGGRFEEGSLNRVQIRAPALNDYISLGDLVGSHSLGIFVMFPFHCGCRPEREAHELLGEFRSMVRQRHDVVVAGILGPSYQEEDILKNLPRNSVDYFLTDENLLQFFHHDPNRNLRVRPFVLVLSREGVVFEDAERFSYTAVRDTVLNIIGRSLSQNIRGGKK